VIEGRAFLTIPETAELLRLSQCSIRRLIASRRLAAIKLSGRYSRTLIAMKDVQALVERSRVAAIGEQ
jgi:excisionase family DNA binding protein